jgi:hypothetical protein
MSLINNFKTLFIIEFYLDACLTNYSSNYIIHLQINDTQIIELPSYINCSIIKENKKLINIVLNLLY